MGRLKIKDGYIRCWECNIKKFIDEFEKNKKNKSGVSFICNECKSKRGIKISKSDRNKYKRQLKDFFYSSTVIKNNLKLMADNYTEEDILIYCRNCGYDDKWLQEVFEMDKLSEYKYCKRA